MLLLGNAVNARWLSSSKDIHYLVTHNITYHCVRCAQHFCHLRQRMPPVAFLLSVTAYAALSTSVTCDGIPITKRTQSVRGSGFDIRRACALRSADTPVSSKNPRRRCAYHEHIRTHIELKDVRVHHLREKHTVQRTLSTSGTTRGSENCATSRVLAAYFSRLRREASSSSCQRITTQSYPTPLTGLLTRGLPCLSRLLNVAVMSSHDLRTAAQSRIAICPKSSRT